MATPINFRNIINDADENLYISGNVIKFASNADGKYWVNLTSLFAASITPPATVSSVAQTVPTGFAISGSPITNAGTLAITNTFTAGSVVFAMGTGFAQDNANFFWDDTNNRLGIGVNSSLGARVQIKGVDNTTSNYGIIVEDANSNDHFYVRNDGETTIRTGTNQKFVFNNGNLSITDDSGIIRNTTFTADNINFSYTRFTTSNINLTTNGVTNGVWDIDFSTSNSSSDVGTTRFMYVHPTINQSNVANFVCFHYSPTVTAIGGRHYAAIFEKGDFILGGTSANASSTFQIDSTTKGFLPPRMTIAQRNAISSPATGLTIYCTDETAVDASTGVLQVYNGATWKKCW